MAGHQVVGIGRLVRGLDVVRGIAALPTLNDRPIEVTPTHPPTTHQPCFSALGLCLPAMLIIVAACLRPCRRVLTHPPCLTQDVLIVNCGVVNLEEDASALLTGLPSSIKAIHSAASAPLAAVGGV